MHVPLIEQVKIQAQVLVPLVRTLQAELGEERANAVWRTQGGSKLGERLAIAFEEFAAGDALDYKVFKQTTDSFELSVTGRRYAKFYQEIGAP